MKRIVGIVLAAATAACSADAQTVGNQPTPLGTVTPIVPSTISKNATNGSSFRPQPSRQLPSLRQASQGLNTVLDASRPTGYGGLLGITGAAPGQTPSSGAVQRLRSQQSARGRQRLALNRSASNVATKHHVSHILVPNLEVVGEAPAAPATTSTPAAVTTELQSRLRLGSLAVERKGRAVVVTGTAPSEQRRDLVTQFLLLEPGVDSVDNRMSVAPAR